MKKALIWLIVLLMMSSCSQTPAQENDENTLQESSSASDTDKSVQSDESQELLVSHNVPDTVKFGGATFCMLSPDEYSGQCIIEETTGDVLNDERYYTQLNTEETLKVVIEETLTPFWTMTNDVAALFMSGDTTYGCVTMMDRFALSSAQEGYYFPIQNVKYIDPSAKYNGEKLTESMSLGGNMYFFVGSYNMKSYEKTDCLFINTDLANDVGVEVPYEDVKNGTWTFDKYKSYGSVATRDLDGNGEMTAADQFTYASGDMRAIPAISWIAAGVSTVQKDEFDMPYVYVQNEKFLSILENVHSLYFADPNCYNSYTVESGEIGADFSTGRILFTTATLANMVSYRDMEKNFTVLPYPKYDEYQDRYYSRTSDSMFTMIPTTCTQPDMAGAVLEVMSCIGYNKILPAYIEDSLQKKFSRFPETAEMVQLVYDTRQADIAEFCVFDYLGDEAMKTLMLKGPDEFGSQLKGIEKLTNIFIKQIVEKLESTINY